MTSAATRKRRASRLLWRKGEEGNHGRGLPSAQLRIRPRTAFTLIELVLSLMVVSLLVAVMVANLPALVRTRRLAEGADRFQTMLYMARADAANLGRRLRLAFRKDDEGITQLALLWESDPLGAPRQFTDYSACTWQHHVPTDLVEVISSRLIGSAAYGLMEGELLKEATSEVDGLDPVTFYPDGSCDSAVIELAALGGSDERRAVIEIDGLTGRVTRRLLTAAELEEEHQQED